MKKFTAFCKKEVVLVAATILAVLSAFAVPPSVAYLQYIDWHVLGILLSLMTVMAGLQKNGLFDALGEALLKRTKKVWQLVLVLVMLCFFLSMAITNDVALITFVPFAVVTLEKSKKERLLIPVIVLQTLAANLGSMLTPIGNPQNLYLYNLSGMEMGEFVGVMLPYTIASLVLLLGSILLIKGKQEAVAVGEVSDTSAEEAERDREEDKIGHRGSVNGNSHGKMRSTWIHNIVYLVLFVLAFLVVLKVLPFEPVLVLVLAITFFMEREVLKTVDYSLLFTFIAFFVFTGNMGNIPAIKETLQSLVAGREVLVGVVASQGISNVPAALLLSGFTADYKALLVGVNLGGLGTLIASMASLISYKIFANKYNEKKGKYFFWFTVSNILYLIILVGINLIIE